MKTVDECLKHYRDELNITSHSFYAWKAFNNIAGKNKANLRAINKNALSWNLITYSLQCTFFISLGRLFDPSGNSFSIHRLLRFCDENIDEFSKDNLRKRKAGNGPKPEWLEDYIRVADEPHQADLRELKIQTKKWNKIFLSKYQPIRHKIFAHKEIEQIGKNEKLFGETNIGEIEEMLTFLHAIESYVFQLFHNGRIQKLSEYTNDIEQRASEDMGSLIEQIKKGSMA